ncbi:mechanosensitive ion channel domain-containing protein [Sphingomonas sp. LY29]|uniref:mechanosensitive ion channel family protein n=1 Tax=unclassified Sphingomonas TaxID=196159 RepID=UPI002ADEE070|nr:MULTISPECIES: mechanosensitive ion channel domain-containing protein [unclassified Sphingomonas]MEA1073009.1 mechanosensitive ion channel [Sphingomonas sp. LY160]WRP26446.1 mechanosensitive ion channel domain-containing protein [Sphingomonas sp. LY29]
MPNFSQLLAVLPARVPQLDRPVTGTFDWIAANQSGLAVGAVVAAGIVAAMLVLRRFGTSLIARDPPVTGWKLVAGHVLSRTSIAFMVVAAVEIVANYTDIPGPLERGADIAFLVVGAFQAAIWARELILGLVRAKAGDDPGATTLGNAMSLIRVLVSVAAFAIAAIVVLDNLGVNVTALVAGLGIGGIAIGLAAQGIFSDLFAALAIVFDRPFRRGDTIRFDKAVGTVERIGLKTTRIRSLTGEQIIMANTKLLERELHNLADGRVRRTTLLFGLTYQTPPEKLAQIDAIAREVVEGCKGCRFIRCAMTTFGASSLDHELVFENRTLDADRLAHDRGAIMIALITRFASEGIEFAYPTQVSYTAAPDGSLVLPYTEQVITERALP